MTAVEVPGYSEAFTAGNVRAFVDDMAARAGHAAWQGAAAAVGAEWAASGLDVAHVTDFSSVQKVIGAAVVGAGASVLSMFKTLTVAKRQARTAAKAASSRGNLDLGSVVAHVRVEAEDEARREVERVTSVLLGNAPATPGVEPEPVENVPTSTSVTPDDTVPEHAP